MPGDIGDVGTAACGGSLYEDGERKVAGRDLRDAADSGEDGTDLATQFDGS